jgi:phosphate binding protein
MDGGYKHRLFIIMLVISILIGVFSGCAKNNDSNSILIMGSTALQPLAEQAARQFINANPDVSIQVQGGGSGNGLTAVSQGIVSIGNSDIFAEEKSGINSGALEDHKVCVVGFAVITNPGVGVDNITMQQLIDIFTGKIKNWNEIGGKNVPIVIISRPSGSGTRTTFKKYALNGAEEVTGKTLTQDSSGAVLKTVTDTQGAVSYIGLTYIKGNSSVKAVKLDGIEPNTENITNGRYPIWSYEHMYTKGPAQGLTKMYIDYILSDSAKPILQKMSYIPISDMKVTR